MKYESLNDAVELYKTGTASVGYCANQAGITIEEFVKSLGGHEISIFSYESKNELMEESQI